MRKILLASSFSLLLIFSGCNPFATQFCTLTGTPGVPYLILYPCVGNQCPVYASASGTVGGDGTFRVPKQGFSCSGLQSMVIFGVNFGFSLSASPSSVNLESPPTSGTITGQGFDTTYGMPRVDYFNDQGFLVGSVEAGSVSSNGTSLTANMPNLANVYSGTYVVKVTNKASSGYYLNIVGSATMTGWGRDRYDSDGDGFYDDEDCYPYDPSMNCSSTCGGSGPPFELCGPIE